MSLQNKIEIQGHRGARGLFPENTITAFIEAVKMGVDALEMDVIISKDSQVVVSHEGWMNEDFCLQPNGNPVEKNSREKYNLFKMNYAEIVKFDCGRNGNPHFPSQKKISEHKPLLSEVFTKVEAYVKENNLPSVKYNIEIKSDVAEYGIFIPNPKTFVELLYNEIKKNNFLERIIIQSFDVRVLQELRKKDSEIIISLLVENREELMTNLNRLGFIPQIYAPDFVMVNEKLVRELKNMNIKLIPWTVNETSDMEKLISLGVDGIITDYPDKAIELLKSIS